MISFPKASSHITNCKLLTRDTWCFAETWDALPGSTRKIEFCFIFPVDNGSCRWGIACTITGCTETEMLVSGNRGIFYLTMWWKVAKENAQT